MKISFLHQENSRQNLAGVGEADTAKKALTQRAGRKSDNIRNEKAGVLFGTGLSAGAGINGAVPEKKSLATLQQEASITDAGVNQDFMTVMKHTLSEEDYRKITEEGFDFGELDPEEAVNIVDKIKAELAKSGKQIIGYTDDLKLDTLIQALGSESLARALVQNFSEQDLPLTEENIADLSRGWEMVSHLEAPGESDYLFLLDNHLGTELWNLYVAQNSGSRVQSDPIQGDGAEYIQDPGFKKQMEQVLSQAGYEINGENLEKAAWLLHQNLPLTEENLESLEKLQKISVPVTEEHFAYAAADAVAEGKSCVYLDMLKASEGRSSGEAQDLQGKASYERTLSVLEKRGILEQVRLQMTAEVNVKLLESGFAIDTAPIEELLQAIRNAEQSVAGKYFPNQDDSVSRYENWTQTNLRLEQLPHMPARLLGNLTENLADSSLDEVYTQGALLKEQYERANEKYEELMTSPRKDLGDRIETAFRNVDELAREMGLEPTPQVCRSIRILGYNQMEISVDNVNRITEADEAVRNLIQKMTPAATLRMIRDGINPLETSLEELDRYFEKLPESYREQAESYSKYLYGLEKTNQITEEERTSYIGVYRLLHQIQEKDGAAIGAVVDSRAQLQFSNLLSAVRSNRLPHMDVKATEEFGLLQELVHKGESFSISEQIESAYLKERLQELRQAANADAASYEMLEKANLPASAANLLAAQEMTGEDAEGPFRTLKQKRKEGEDTSLKKDAQAVGERAFSLWEELDNKETFQKEYHQVIEEVSQLTEEDTFLEADTSLDVRALQLAHRQLGIAGKLSASEEYLLPMYIGDQLVNVRLSLQSNEAEKGSISIHVDEGNRQFQAQLWIHDRRIEGFLAGKTEEEVTKLKEVSDIFCNLIKEDASVDLEAESLPVVSSENINRTRMSGTNSQGEDTPDNGMLYRVAKLFLQAIR